MCTISWVLPAFLVEQSWAQGSGSGDCEQPTALCGTKCWKLFQIHSSGRSGTSCHKNISHLSNCMLLLHCQCHSSPTIDWQQTRDHLGSILQLPILEERARMRTGWPSPSLAAPNYPHFAQGSMATSVTVFWPCDPQQGWGTPALTWIYPSPRFILSSVDIFLRFSQDGWEDNTSASIMTRAEGIFYSRGCQEELCLIWSLSRTWGRYP